MLYIMYRYISKYELQLLNVIYSYIFYVMYSYILKHYLQHVKKFV